MHVEIMNWRRKAFHSYASHVSFYIELHNYSLQLRARAELRYHRLIPSLSNEIRMKCTGKIVSGRVEQTRLVYGKGSTFAHEHNYFSRSLACARRYNTVPIEL